jgi:hypothetical protein
MAKRARTERRKMERDGVKLARARMKLASLEPGGAAERPIDVTSASVVEVHASSLPCAACGASGVRVEEHVAVTVDQRALRIARTICPRCGARRDVYFRIAKALPS